MHGKISKISEIPINELLHIINSSNTVSEVLIKLGFNSRGNNNETLYKRAKRDNIDLTDLKERSNKYQISRLKNRPNIIKIPLTRILVKDSTYNSSYNLKNRLLKEKILTNKCYNCNLTDYWMDKPIKLQLHHINGIRTDNRLDNLILLCPNCHSQTETFAGKSLGKRHCKICKNTLKKRICDSDICYDCYIKHIKNKSLDEVEIIKSKYNIQRPQAQRLGNHDPKPNTRKSERPPPSQLIQEIKDTNFCAVGRKYGVSDNAIRKWCRSYDIDLNIFKKQS